MSALGVTSPLPGWVSTVEAAAKLGVSKQMVHKYIARKRFPSVRRIGSVYVIAAAEVEDLARARKARFGRATQMGSDAV